MLPMVMSSIALVGCSLVLALGFPFRFWIGGDRRVRFHAKRRWTTRLEQLLQKRILDLKAKPQDAEGGGAAWADKKHEVAWVVVMAPHARQPYSHNPPYEPVDAAISSLAGAIIFWINVS